MWSVFLAVGHFYSLNHNTLHSDLVTFSCEHATFCDNVLARDPEHSMDVFSTCAWWHTLEKEKKEVYIEAGNFGVQSEPLKKRKCSLTVGKQP